MNILIIGSGGREHAMATLISRSPHNPKIFIAPGNGGSSLVGTPVNIKVTAFEEQLHFCRRESIDLILVGPEQPLVEGIADFFQTHAPEIKIIGPTKSAARLEGSKAFSKQLMIKYGIPTSAYKSFTIETLTTALDYVGKHALPVVIKADGLAAGKGVIIADTHNAAVDTVKDMLSHHQFGTAGQQVVIEEFLTGIELSVFVLTDGKDYVILPEAKDYKRIGEGDTGPNTGGMGAVSPVPFFKGEFREKVIDKIIKPTLAGLKAEGIHYQGFIFFGLINCDGEPFVIEYNARMGDPETEAVLPRIKSDFLNLLLKCAEGKLGEVPPLEFSDEHSCAVVLASSGYPGPFETGKAILFAEENLDPNSDFIFHAGTSQSESQGIVTSGGRVLVINSLGKNIQYAISKVYALVDLVHFEQKVYRKDIGADILRLNKTQKINS